MVVNRAWIVLLAVLAVSCIPTDTNDELLLKLKRDNAFTPDFFDAVRQGAAQGNSQHQLYQSIFQHLGIGNDHDELQSQVRLFALFVILLSSTWPLATALATITPLWRSHTKLSTVRATMPSVRLCSPMCVMP